MEQPILIVSGDGHTGAPPEAYRDYIEPRYRGDIDRLIDENDEWVELAVKCTDTPPEVLDIIDAHRAIRDNGELGAWDMERRLQELDREGVAGELLLPGHSLATLPFFGLVNCPCPPELRMAGSRAYRRWLADQMQIAPGRFYGIAEPGPCLDMDDTVKELRWLAANGFVGVQVPGIIADPHLPPLHHPHFEPFWQACAELGLVLVLHAGWGGQQGIFQQFLDRVKLGGHKVDFPQQRMAQRAQLDTMANSDPALALNLMPRQALWRIMLSGAFDRYPGLRVSLTELRCDWVPATLEHLDRCFAQLKNPLPRTPSAYFAEHCVVTPSSPRRSEIGLRHVIGVDRFLFGMDYPHPEGTWPNTRGWLRAAVGNVPEAEARKILGENAIATFGLDRDALALVAQRIGPAPAEIFGSHSVDPQMLHDFDVRAGFDQPPEKIDIAAIDQAFAADREPLAAL